MLPPYYLPLDIPGIALHDPDELDSDGPDPPTEDGDHDDDILQPNYVIFSITLILVFLVVIGNSITILVFSSTPKLCNQTGLCLINLAIADILTGIIYLPFSLPCALSGECMLRTNRALCLSVVTVSYTCYGASFYTLVIVMIDRYLQIDRPFTYNQIFSKTRTSVILVSTWLILLFFTSAFTVSRPQIIKFEPKIYHCTIAAADESSWPYTYCVNILFFFVPCIVIGGCSCRIAMIAHRARSRIADQQAAVACASSEVTDIERRRPSRIFCRSEFRVALRIFIVVGVFIICCLPFHIELIYARHTEDIFPSKAAFFTVFMVEINSVLNPIIYVTTYSKFRRVFKAKYMKLCQRSRSGESIVWTVTSNQRAQYSPSRRRESGMAVVGNLSPTNRTMSTVIMTAYNGCVNERIPETVPEEPNGGNIDSC